jgi:hypothetical protein
MEEMRNSRVRGALDPMATLKEFEDALREQGMHMALAILERLRERDRAKRSIAPARRVTGRKMTPNLARQILEIHANTGMTQQEIAFQLGVNQGRVNEVIKRGKWLSDDPNAPEAVARDKALDRMAQGIGTKPHRTAHSKEGGGVRKKAAKAAKPGKPRAQLSLGDF